jgi:xylulose-5-phosphate/fructose-6-phosphate phosphoketolase
METGTALASMNLCKLISGKANGRVLPILHLNGYKISGPTILGRKSEREIHEFVRGFGYEPLEIYGDRPMDFLFALETAHNFRNPFLILRTEKGAGGPDFLDGKKIAGNFAAHQIPLPLVKTDERQLEILENWLMSYKFSELFDGKEFTI